jgi:hypothetical protein
LALAVSFTRGQLAGRAPHVAQGQKKMSNCVVCGKPIAEGEQYACVWIEGAGSLQVAFAHLPCAESMEDITAEVTDKEEQ